MDAPGSSSTSRSIILRLILLTELRTSATADVKYTLCPLMQLSPKKSPALKIPSTPPRPRFETKVSFTTPSSMWCTSLHSSPCEIIVSPAWYSTIFLAGSAAPKKLSAPKMPRPRGFIDPLVSSFVGHPTDCSSASMIVLENVPFYLRHQEFVCSKLNRCLRASAQSRPLTLARIAPLR